MFQGRGYLPNGSGNNAKHLVCSAKLTLVAFNLNEEKVLYRQEAGEQVNFPALGESLKALNLGTRDTIADPQKALALLKQRDALMKLDIEKMRLALALELTDTPHVASAGLSSVTPEKLNRTIDATVMAYVQGATLDTESDETQKSTAVWLMISCVCPDHGCIAYW